MSAQELMDGSGFSRVDQTSNPATYVRRLDETGAREFWQSVKRRMVVLLDLQEGDQLLDVGCGTGDDVRALAQLVGPTGRAVGVDASATMVAEARKRAEGLDLPVAYHQGDACHLAFPDGTFDGCRAERVLQHLDDPDLALAELVRVARSGARIVVVEPDYGTLVIRGADEAVTGRILRKRREHFRSATIGRRLPEICKKLGLVQMSITLLTNSSTDITRPGERRLLRKYAGAANSAGLVSEAQAVTWLAELEEAGRTGRYRHALTVFLVSGIKR